MEHKHLSITELEAGLEEIRRSPCDDGVLELIVRRPATDQREELAEGVLDLESGLVGDKWQADSGSVDSGGVLDRSSQITIMNSRAAALVARSKDRRQLAGDQLYIDMNLSDANLPPGSRISIGSAILEVSPVPHTGCGNFRERFGSDALKFVNSPVGKELNLRGIHAWVVKPGRIRVGDRVVKMAARSGAKG